MVEFDKLNFSMDLHNHASEKIKFVSGEPEKHWHAI